MASSYSVLAYYSGGECTTGGAYQVLAVEDANCTSNTCSDNDISYSVLVSTECSTDYATSMTSVMSYSSNSIIVARFSDENCTNLINAYGATKSKTCMENQYGGGYEAMLNPDGSAWLAYYSDSTCASIYANESADRDLVASHECSPNRYKWYAVNEVEFSTDVSGSVDSSSSSSRRQRGVPDDSHSPATSPDASDSVNALAIVTLIFSCIVVGLVAIIVVLYRRLKRQKPMESRSGLWDDDTIIATRIPRNKISIKKLLSRGAYGEVYSGVFNRQQVAVKMLLPSSRTDLQQVHEFLTEAKMTATMDHPHIVYYVGVAWDSLSDLCVVLEFMNGGDLRTLLNRYEAECRPVGFDRQKVTIALHICHALTYLHSLATPIIHRDLKSRNILLNHTMTAKLTDFGISRERPDKTMTAGVGTSLWMAPEVMLGEKYDVKADIFSFGVVMSELDVHTMPYTLVKQRCRETEGREIPEPSLLQKVSTGEVSVEFSYMSPSPIVELARACVSIDPSGRPAAAEVLYRLQVILAQEWTA